MDKHRFSLALVQRRIISEVTQVSTRKKSVNYKNSAQIESQVSFSRLTVNAGMGSK